MTFVGKKIMFKSNGIYEHFKNLQIQFPHNVEVMKKNMKRVRKFHS